MGWAKTKTKTKTKHNNICCCCDASCCILLIRLDWIVVRCVDIWSPFRASCMHNNTRWPQTICQGPRSRPTYVSLVRVGLQPRLEGTNYIRTRYLVQQMYRTLLEPQSRFGDKALKFQVVCPQNGTEVLKGLASCRIWVVRPKSVTEINSALVHLGDGVRMIYFFCAYLCSTPLAKLASLRSAKNCAFSSVLLSCLLAFYVMLASLRGLNFFLSLFLLDGCVIFSILISIFRRRVVVFILLPIFCGWYVVFSSLVFSVCVATCPAYRMYLIRTCADLLFYVSSEV